MAAPHLVVAVLALERVVAVAARERVVAGAALEQVVARAAAQQVVVALAEQHVVAGAALQGVVAVLPVDPVVAVAALREVVAAAAPDLVVAAAAQQRVVARAAQQRVRGAVVGVHRGIAVVEVHRVVADQQVVAVAALDAVAAVAALDAVVARAAAQRVAVRAAVDRVVARAAVGDVAARAGLDPVVAAVAVEGVVARVAEQVVAMRAAAQDVVAVAAHERVAAVAALQRVVARLAVELVVAALAADDVVAHPRVDGVVAAAGQHQVLVALGALDAQRVVVVDPVALRVDVGQVDQLARRGAVDHAVGMDRGREHQVVDRARALDRDDHVGDVARADVHDLRPVVRGRRGHGADVVAVRVVELDVRAFLDVEDGERVDAARRVELEHEVRAVGVVVGLPADRLLRDKDAAAAVVGQVGVAARGMGAVEDRRRVVRVGMEEVARRAVPDGHAAEVELAALEVRVGDVVEVDGLRGHSGYSLCRAVARTPRGISANRRTDGAPGPGQGARRVGAVRCRRRHRPWASVARPARTTTPRERRAAHGSTSPLAEGAAAGPRTRAPAPSRPTRPCDPARHRPRPVVELCGRPRGQQTSPPSWA